MNFQGGLVNFLGADNVTWAMSKGGGVFVNVFTPPLQEILFPRLYHMRAHNQLTAEVEMSFTAPRSATKHYIKQLICMLYGREQG